jgi:hypothetical protein
MKNFVLMAAALVLGFTMQIGDAEAKRLGGGSSYGMQRQSVAPSKSTNCANASAHQAGAATASPTQTLLDGTARRTGRRYRSGALASHFGFGEGLANS